MKFSKFLIFGLLAVSATVFTSCSKDEKDEAKILVVHASPDAPGVDLLVDDEIQNSAALNFPDNTGYITVEAGTRNIKVNASGTSTSVINANVTLEKDKNYSVFAYNTLASIGALVLEDNLAAPASGKAHVRFAHLSPDAPAVDITLPDGTVLFGDYTFGEASAFTPVDAGTYTLEARPAGTPIVALSVPGVVLEAGKIYTVYAGGFLAPPAGNTNAVAAHIIQHN